jgi:excisionase family DNA binding protein
MPITADETLTVAEAAPLVALSARGFYRAIAAGHIPPGVYFRIGRDIYVSRERLLAWRNAGGTAASEEMRGAALACA